MPENIRAAMNAFGEEARYASDTISGIEKLATEKFDLVISDLNMEHRQSGLDIAYSAGMFATPTYIATGGYGHGKNFVALYPRDFTHNIQIDGSKSDPQVWTQIKERIGEGYLTLSLKLIKEGIIPGRSWPWEMLEWVYLADTGFYQPPNHIKKLVAEKLKLKESKTI